MTRSLRSLVLALLAGAGHIQAQTDPRETPDIKTLGEVPVKAGSPGAPPEALAPKVREIVERQSVGNTIGRASCPVEVPDVLFHDEVAGSLQVSSRRYKAAFSTAGVTFVPFLGSHAPRNFALMLTFEEARVGSVPIVLAGTLLPTRAGDVISYDRGLVRELYEAGTRHIEQKFVLHAWPGAGDLVVRMRVSTELPFAETPEGFQFRNAYGGVTYGKATVLDADGRAEPAPSRFENGAIELVVPAAFLVSARYPVTIDPVFLPHLVEGGTPNTFLPDIAYDATTERYLVIFEEAFSAADHDIWAETRDVNGAPIAGSGGYIDRTGDDWRQAKVANNNLADSFLVVAQRRPQGGTAWAIWGRTRAAASVTMGNQFQISGSETGDKLVPDVGGDPGLVGPTHYCVVWQRNFSPTDLDVHFRLVAPDGTFPAGVNFLENAGNRIDYGPSISKSNGNPPVESQIWNLIWSFQHTPTDADVFAARVRRDGTVLNPTSALSTSLRNQSEPAISSPTDDASTSGRTFLSAWEEEDGELRGGVLASLPIPPPFGLNFNLSEIMGQTPGIREASPSVDSDGCRFALAFEELTNPTTGDWNVYVATLHVRGTLERTDAPRFWMFPSTQEASPEITSTRSSGGPAVRYGAVWDSYPTAGNGNIYLGLYDGRTPLGGHSAGVAGCGGLVLTAGGIAALGASVSYTLSGLQGAALILLGSPATFPLCPVCTIGVNLTGALIAPTPSLALMIPCDTRLLGAVLAVQGGDYPSAGGCPLPGGTARTSNSIRITIQ